MPYRTQAKPLPLLSGLISSFFLLSSAQSSSSTVPLSTAPVTTTALPGSDTPPNHWTPDRPDPYVCEYLGENDCWRPSHPHETGAPFSGWTEPRPERPTTCTVKALNDPTQDDAPAVTAAFQKCHKNAHIIFENTTYHIASVMNTTGLQNVDVEVRGTLAWNNSDIDYWRNNSLPVGFQNQSSAWHFGGDQVHFFGHGYGTIDGNGQVWYDYNNGTSNLHGRPHAITITDTTESIIEGLRFWRSQMWTMTIARSEKILLQDIYVNNTCEPGAGTFDRCNVNTDACDTVYANNITFLRWETDVGDDAIALKQNSTNIYVADSHFYNGLSIAFGSIGQYPGQIEVIENFTARNIYSYNSDFGCRIKTWTGLHKGVPPNGGGGGIGHARNLTCEGFTFVNSTWAWVANQATSYNGQEGGSDTSLFQIEDLHFGDSTGTLKTVNATSFQCSANAPCPGIDLYNNTFTVFGEEGQEADGHLCSEVLDPNFECTSGCGPENAWCPSF